MGGHVSLRIAARKTGHSPRPGKVGIGAIDTPVPRDRHDFPVGGTGARDLRPDRDDAPVSHAFQGSRVDAGDMMGPPIHTVDDQPDLLAQFVGQIPVENPPLDRLARRRAMEDEQGGIGHATRSSAAGAV